ACQTPPPPRRDLNRSSKSVSRFTAGSGMETSISTPGLGDASVGSDTSTAAPIGTAKPEVNCTSSACRASPSGSGAWTSRGTVAVRSAKNRYGSTRSGRGVTDAGLATDRAAAPAPKAKPRASATAPIGVLSAAPLLYDVST
ncbi:MAG: hypothetical protein ACREAQ_08480, partial [Nitrososphaera sp.]